MFVEKERIYDFLAGLNLEFDAVRVQTLEMEDLPSLNEMISIVQAEEGRRGVMLEISSIESSALVMVKGSSLEKQPKEERKVFDSSKVINKVSLWCNYYKKPRHTIESALSFMVNPLRVDN